MGMPLSSGRLEMLREAKLKKLQNAKPLVSGSLTKIMRKCGNSNCRCAEGEKHPAYILSWKESQKTKNLYVPVDMVKEVETWVKEERKIQRLIQEITNISHQMIKQHVSRKRSKAKNQRLQKT